MKYYPPTLHTQHHAMKHLPPQHATNSQNSPIFIMQGRTFFHNTHHAPTTHPHRGDISFNQQARNIAKQQEPTEKNCLRHHHDSGATPPPRKVARNSIGRSFNKVRKRCNSNDLNSMFERVAGELRAKLGVDSAMRQRGVDATPVRWRGLAGLQDNAPGHTPQRKHRRCGGHRKDLPRCRWAAAGPGRASSRRAERSSQRGRRAGGRAGRAAAGDLSGEQATTAGITRPRGGRPRA